MEGRTQTTDGNGMFCFTFPVEEQSATKEIRIGKDGFKDYVREDECPSKDLTYILRKQ